MEKYKFVLPTSLKGSKELLESLKGNKVYTQFQIIEGMGGNNEENWKIYYGDDWKEFRQKELEAHRKFHKEKKEEWIEALKVHIFLLERAEHSKGIGLVRIYPKGPVDDSRVDTK